MSTITPTITRTRVPSSNVWIATWASLGNADTGSSVAMAGASDRSVQFAGTFGSATVLLEGSNDGTNWATLTDPQGNAISKTSAAIEQISELTQFIRVSTSGGSGTAITATVLLKGMTQ